MATDKPIKHAHNFIDLTGQRFGQLLVLSLYSSGKDSKWMCRCDCGTEKAILGAALRSRRSASCGCVNRNRLGNASRTHGRRHTKEYLAWTDAKTRCFNTGYITYKHYGGRGITMCEEWRNSFQQFFDDMGPCPIGMSLDRIDVNGPYSKTNCRWTTHIEQCHNRRNNIMVEYNGETLPLWEWSARSGIPLKILYGRYWRGTEILGPRKRRWAKRPID